MFTRTVYSSEAINNDCEIKIIILKIDNSPITDDLGIKLLTPLFKGSFEWSQFSLLSTLGSQIVQIERFLELICLALI